MTKRLITAILFVGVLLTGLIAYQIVGPDDEECKAAIGQVIDDSIARSMDDEPQVSDEEAAKVIRWPCRLQTKKQVMSWTNDAINSRVPMIFADALAKTFSS